ncbi:D-ribose pyranase [Salibacterium aidingense]|uniref:D-ribose pyranase n=1 Tax=Salibacterium aidingense TaxID=384933 RepID=UPI0004086C8B|nr:D-ribose pyranase [Salibacterium aidingense]
MKKQGMLNGPISNVLAQLGHTDTVVIADCGLPVPPGVEKIDLALTLGTPSFLETLDAVLEDMEVEDFTFSQEIMENNTILHDAVLEKTEETRIHYLSHEEFKKETQHARAIIRTGEATPFANVILKAGVIFS